MITTVRNYIRKQNLLKKGDRVTVGFSGGADSVCLLLCLRELQEEYALSLRAVHMHHGLRGEEADRDAEFCRALCQRWQIPFVLRKAPVREYASQQRLSCEEAGRILRYQILREEAAGGRIAVAHHRGDQAETLLFHLLRGTGVRGLAGMAPLQRDIIRPLLCVNRRQIEEYLSERGQDYQMDSTNQADDYTRNKIRHQLLPVLAEFNPRAEEHLCQLAEQARESEAFLEQTAAGWLAEHGSGGPEERQLPLAELRTLEAAVGKRVLLLALTELSGSRRDIGYVHICKLWELRESPVGSRLSLPGGWQAERGYRELRLRRSGSIRYPLPDEVRLSQPDMSPGQPMRYTFTIFPAEKGQKISEKQYAKWFDYDKIKNSVQMRFRRQGDYFALTGGGHKTVKAYMIDRKIPAEERDRIPLFADGSHVLWIVGYRISEAYKVTEQTRRILQISIGGEEDGG